MLICLGLKINKFMSLIRLVEFSPDTPEGSRSRDLDTSKLWLCQSLKKLGLDQFDNVYILGSWYGSLSLFLLVKHIKFKRAINIDWSHEKTEYVNHIIKRAALGNKIRAIARDCNDIEYQGEQMAVINTSTNDIEGMDWFDHIPSNTLVVLQGRDHQGTPNGIDTLSKFNRAYPLNKTLLLDTIPLTGVDDDVYHRFMKIGFK